MGVFIVFLLIAGACVWAFWGFFSGFLGGLLGAHGHDPQGSDSGWGDAALLAGYAALAADDEREDWDDEDRDEADYDDYDVVDYDSGFDDGGAGYSDDYH